MGRSTLPRAPSRRGLQLGLVALAALVAVLLVPSSALADATDLKKSIAGKLDTSVGVNTIWVIVAGSLVMFMQAGFAFLEIGFSRAKNAGTGIAKILTNFSIASIAYWAVGFALAFGGAGAIAGTHGFFLDVSSVPSEAAKQFPLLDVTGISPAALLFFQFVFCAVSLAIVWGTTL